MPTQQLTYNLGLSPSNTLQAFQNAASQLGWQIVSYNHFELICQEVINMSSFSLPAKVIITAKGNGCAGTQVTLSGSIGGIGPIQSNHLKKQLETLTSTVSRQTGQALSQSLKIERSFWEKLGAPITELGEEYFGHEQFVRQLLALPYDQMLQTLQMKVKGMNDRAFKGFYWSLIGIYLVQFGRAQNLASVFRSRESWGNTFEDRYAQFEAEMKRGGPSPQQRWASQQAQKQADAILMLAGYAKQFRK